MSASTSVYDIERDERDEKDERDERDHRGMLLISVLP
jgi:hypothetical protein